MKSFALVTPGTSDAAPDGGGLPVGQFLPQSFSDADLIEWGEKIGDLIGMFLTGIPFLGHVIGMIITALIGLFGGLDDRVKTAQIGARLEKSKVPAIKALGAFVAWRAKNGWITSRVSDNRTQFTPAIIWTATALKLTRAQTDALIYVIRADRDIESFDRIYIGHEQGKPQIPDLDTVYKNIGHNGEHHIPPDFLNLISKFFVKQDGGGNGADCKCIQDCCTKVAIALSTIAVAVQAEHPQVANELANFRDCVCTELNRLVDAENTFTYKQFPKLFDALKGVEKAIATSGAATADKLVKPIEKLQEQKQLKEGLWRSLGEAGTLPAELGQLLSGTGAEDAEAVISSVLGYVLGWGAKTEREQLERLSKYVYGPMIVAIWQIVKDTVRKAGPEVPALMHEIGGIGKTLVGALEDVYRHTFGLVGENILLHLHEKVRQEYKKPGSNYESVVGALLGEAAFMGSASHLASTAFEMLHPSKELGIHQIAGMIEKFAGFEALIEAAHDPLLKATIEIPGTYAANEEFRPRHIPHFIAVELAARRLLGIGVVKDLIGKDGVDKRYEDAILAGRFRPASPRALSTLAEDAGFDRDSLRDSMQYNGYRETDIELMLDAFDQRALHSSRQALLSEAMLLYGDGLLEEFQLDNVLDQVRVRPEARALWKKRANLRLGHQIAKQLEAGARARVAAGMIDFADYRAALVAAGYTDAMAKALVAAQLGKYQGQIFRVKVREDAANARKFEAASVKAVTGGFEAGDIPGPALPLLLHQAGLSPEMAEAVAALELVKSHGHQTFLFGRMVAAHEANDLRLKVATIEEQYRKKQINADGFAEALKKLSVPDSEIRALRSSLDAKLAPKPAAT